ncbi:MAG: DUF2796 domain-containing protein [Azoarcus sp.]|jgi:hypothetical protein|nr:DUF2796 domain-containing protein [Azoarcus sp.]
MQKTVFLFGMAFASIGVAHAAPPHVHGEAHLEITLEDKRLVMTLEAPLEVALGFERAPDTAEEKQKAAALTEQLRHPEQLFTLDPAAQCVFAATGIESPVLAEKHAGHAHEEHAHEDPHEDHEHAGRAHQAEEAHHDLRAQFQATCQKPEVLHGVDILLFKTFPRLSRLRAAFAGPKGQRAGELDARHPRFSW